MPYKLMNKEVALTSCNIYNSFFNISAELGNNKITLTFPNMISGGNDFTFTFPDGFYSASDMNYYLQSQMILNALYCVNSANQNVYFAEIVANSTTYAINLNFYIIPTTAQATTLGYTQAPGANWSYPTSTTANNIPKVTILTSGFGDLIGFTATSYPTTISASSNQQFSSTSTPEISLVQSIVILTNLINNIGFSNPSNVLTSLPVNVAYGQMISHNVNAPVFQKVSNNMYGQIVIQLYDQNLNVIIPKDLDVLISLAIRDQLKPQ
jgi:hypothetical protein